jgi:hypothetical protein
MITVDGYHRFTATDSGHRNLAVYIAGPMGTSLLLLDITTMAVDGLPTITPSPSTELRQCSSVTNGRDISPRMETRVSEMSIILWTPIANGGRLLSGGKGLCQGSRRQVTSYILLGLEQDG